MPALGERFRAAREARGLSLSDVSEQIRIRSVYLAAIEEENWGSIGAPVYIRGFLRTYARFLGLDPEEVVAFFNGAPQPSINAKPAGLIESPRVPVTSASSSPPVAERPPGRGSLLIWVAAVVAIVLVAYVAYSALTFPRPAAPVATASLEPTALPSNSPQATGSPGAGVSAAPGVSPGSGVSPGPSGSPGLDGPNSLAVMLSAPSWLRVTIDGNVSMEGTFPAGTSKTFHGKNALVRIGNAGGVEIFVDGKDVGKLGKSGDVAERTFTL
jgi:cytoskeletal protein RodZ